MLTPKALTYYVTKRVAEAVKGDLEYIGEATQAYEY